MKRAHNNRFDVTGHETLRLIKLSAFGKIIPVGNWRGGPGLRCLVIVSVLHYFGYPLYWLNARYGHKLGLLKRFVRRA